MRGKRESIEKARTAIHTALKTRQDRRREYDTSNTRCAEVIQTTYNKTDGRPTLSSVYGVKRCWPMEWTVVRTVKILQLKKWKVEPTLDQEWMTGPGEWTDSVGEGLLSVSTETD